MVFNGTFCAANPSGPTGRANPKQALMIAWTPRRLAARSCTLGMSKAELIEGMANLTDDDEEAALSLAQTFSDAHDLARELVKITRAAEIRILCAFANCCAVRE
jgi:hypothetical protein